jgi:hypothetical protein
MPLQLPNLDDRTYTDLMAEALALIPTQAPEWTNHNPSDPGITLIELFAFLTEMLLYRQNRITDDSVRMFLRLLNGPDWRQTQDLREEMRLVVLGVRERYRAVTCEDFARLAMAAASEVVRAHCLPRRNLASENPLDRAVDRPGHVSVIIIPKDDTTHPQPGNALLQTVQDYLESRRLLTTRVHVVEPHYFSVGVRLTLMLERDALEEKTRQAAVTALQRFLAPLTGGPQGKGWPFGRNVYISEIYRLLDNLPGVDYVTRTDDQDELVVSDPGRLVRNASGELVAVTIEPGELVAAWIETENITAVSPVQ